MTMWMSLMSVFGALALGATSSLEYRFLLNVINSYDSTASLDSNVYAIMTLLCPKSVYCPDTVKQQEAFVNASIFTSSDNNVITARKYIIDNRLNLNICCKECSCAKDCHEKQNCCPTMESKDVIKTSTIKQKCEYADINALRGVFLTREFYGHSFYIVDDCYTAIDIETETYSKCRNPNISVPEEVTPVYSQASGRIYRSQFCSLCNNEQNFIPWKIEVVLSYRMVIDGGSLLPADPLGLYNFVLEYHKLGHIIFLPPEQMPIAEEETLCVDISRAETVVCDTRAIPVQDPYNFLQRACEQYTFVYTYSKIIGHNLFCDFCTGVLLKQTPPLCRSFKRLYGLSFSSILALDKKQTENTRKYSNDFDEHLPHSCGCTELYDANLNTCRPIYCPVGELFVDCSCRLFMDMIAGLYPRVYMDLTLDLAGNEAAIKSLVKDNLIQSIQAAMKPVFNPYRRLFRIKIEHIIFNSTWDTRAIFHCISIIHISPDADFKEMSKTIFKLLRQTSMLVIEQLPMRMTMTEEISDSDTQTNQNNMSGIVHIKSQQKEYVTIPLNQLIFCQQIQLIEDEISTLKNKSIIKGYNSVDLYYAYRSVDNRMCLQDYQYIFFNISFTATASYKKIDMVAILLSVVIKIS